MNLLHCTQKLLRDIGLDSEQLVDENVAESQATLGNWYANLLKISARKVMIFTNEKTLYSFIITGATKLNHLRVKTALQDGMKSSLLSEGIAEKIANKLCAEYDELGFAKTKNRRVLGSMNDLAKMFDSHVHYQGGWKYCDEDEITKMVNRAPMKYLEYKYPIEVLHTLLPKSLE